MPRLPPEPEGFPAISPGSRSAPGDTEPICCPPTLKGSQGVIVLSPVVASTNAECDHDHECMVPDMVPDRVSRDHS
jgi:hypothetical protein